LGGTVSCDVQNLSIELLDKVELALWDPFATAAQFDTFCEGAARAKVRAVCVPSAHVALAVAKLEETSVKVVALTGFPLGSSDPDVKRFEAETAIDFGAQEIELVLNTGRILEGAWKALLRELHDIVECADERPVCSAIETHALTVEQIVSTCHLLLDAGVTTVASNTGFCPRPTDPGVIKLIRESTSPRFQIKATPVSREEDAQALLSAGATRLGVIVGQRGQS
jgi:deoxyribose-phosphate aldolase